MPTVKAATSEELAAELRLRQREESIAAHKAENERRAEVRAVLEPFAAVAADPELKARIAKLEETIPAFGSLNWSLARSAQNVVDCYKGLDDQLSRQLADVEASPEPVFPDEPEPAAPQ